MKKNITFMLAITLIISTSSLCTAQKKGKPAAEPISSPALAPEPHKANITELLTVAGPFLTFLGYLQSTKVLKTFEDQANTTEGLTLFVPKDSTFASLKNPSLKNLTQEQLKNLCLFHALPHYYSLADFKNLSGVGPVPSFAGGDYTLNFTDVSGTIHMTTGWSVTKISSSVWSTEPVALYQVDKVLLPEAIFGTDIPPTAAPAPAPESEAPAADSPADDDKAGKAPSKSKDSSGSSRVLGGFGLGLLGIVLMFL